MWGVLLLTNAAYENQCTWLKFNRKLSEMIMNSEMSQSFWECTETDLKIFFSLAPLTITWTVLHIRGWHLYDESQPFICSPINEEMLPAFLHTAYNQSLVKALHESVIYFEFTLLGTYRGTEGVVMVLWEDNILNGHILVWLYLFERKCLCRAV